MSLFKISRSIILCLLAFSFNVLADPIETPQLTLTRTVADGLELKGVLSKNIYRRYTKSVPYSVEIPYQETITRVVNETYYTMDRVCRVIKKKQICNMERVAHIRRVTKTETVTRLRTKIVCCRTESFVAFDHQEVLPVKLLYPANTQLQNNETETVRIELTGSEFEPDVKTSFLAQLFPYIVKSKGMDQGVFTIEVIEAVP